MVVSSLWIYHWYIFTNNGGAKCLLNNSNPCWANDAHRMAIILLCTVTCGKGVINHCLPYTQPEEQKCCAGSVMRQDATGTWERKISPSIFRTKLFYQARFSSLSCKVSCKCGFAYKYPKRYTVFELCLFTYIKFLNDIHRYIWYFVYSSYDKHYKTQNAVLQAMNKRLKCSKWTYSTFNQVYYPQLTTLFCASHVTNNFIREYKISNKLTKYFKKHSRLTVLSK